MQIPQHIQHADTSKIQQNSHHTMAAVSEPFKASVQSQDNNQSFSCLIDIKIRNIVAACCCLCGCCRDMGGKVSKESFGLATMVAILAPVKAPEPQKCNNKPNLYCLR